MCVVGVDCGSCWCEGGDGGSGGGGGERTAVTAATVTALHRQRESQQREPFCRHKIYALLPRDVSSAAEWVGQPDLLSYVLSGLKVGMKGSLLDIWGVTVVLEGDVVCWRGYDVLVLVDRPRGGGDTDADTDGSRDVKGGEDGDVVAAGFGRYETGIGDEDGDICTAPNIFIQPIIHPHKRSNQIDDNKSTS
ncbi:hypothetical protein V499_03209 [Pseudogymnoascus sp. VKM F-103]|nr:hypothetical protein V499_03209 [Pseudogymnoascus sp. VKM F-103]